MSRPQTEWATRLPNAPLIWTAGFEPAISASRTLRNTRFSYVQSIGARGFEPPFSRPPAVRDNQTSPRSEYLLFKLARVESNHRFFLIVYFVGRVVAIRFPFVWPTSSLLYPKHRILCQSPAKSLTSSFSPVSLLLAD